MHSVGSFAPFNVSLRKHNTMVVLMNFTVGTNFNFSEKNSWNEKCTPLSKPSMLYVISLSYSNSSGISNDFSKICHNFHCVLMHAKILSYIKQNFELLTIITNKHSSACLLPRTYKNPCHLALWRKKTVSPMTGNLDIISSMIDWLQSTAIFLLEQNHSTNHY